MDNNYFYNRLKLKAMAKTATKKTATKKVVNFEKIEDKIIELTVDIDQLILDNYFKDGLTKAINKKGVKEYRYLAKLFTKKADAWEKLINKK